MKTKDFLRKHIACIDGAKWALCISEDMADIWNAMIAQDKRDWLLWTATRPGVFPDSALRKLVCLFVRETPLHDGRTVWDLLADKHSKRAVEVAEAYADGKATKEELDAAYAAARAAADAAYTAAAHDAAYAAACAAVYAASSADYAAARDAAYAAYTAVADAAYTAADYAARAAVYAVRATAKAAQARMIAELGNPFRKG